MQDSLSDLRREGNPKVLLGEQEVARVINEIAPCRRASPEVQARLPTYRRHNACGLCRPSCCAAVTVEQGSDLDGVCRMRCRTTEAVDALRLRVVHRKQRGEAVPLNSHVLAVLGDEVARLVSA